jgi:hypothetical protein
MRDMYVYPSLAVNFLMAAYRSIHITMKSATDASIFLPGTIQLNTSNITIDDHPKRTVGNNRDDTVQGIP